MADDERVEPRESEEERRARGKLNTYFWLVIIVSLITFGAAGITYISGILLQIPYVGWLVWLLGVVATLFGYTKMLLAFGWLAGFWSSFMGDIVFALIITFILWSAAKEKGVTSSRYPFYSRGREYNAHEAMIWIAFIVYILILQMATIILVKLGMTDSVTIQAVVVIKSVFWPVLTVILFFMQYMECVGRGVKIPWGPKLAFILGIVIMLIFALPGIQSIYTSQIADYQNYAKQITETQTKAATAVVTKLQEQLIRVQCTMSNPTTVDQIPKCVNEGIAAARCKNYKKGTTEYTTCVNAEVKKLSGQTVANVQDENIAEYTKVEFVVPKEFPKQTLQQSPIPMQLNIDSPNKEITVELSCKFIKSSKEVPGQISTPTLKVIGKRDDTIYCMPIGNFEAGVYSAEFTADIKGIKTTSRLKRIFIGDEIKKSETEKSKLLQDYKMSSSESSKSADEFAVFSIGVGTPFTNPFLENRDKQPILGNIENLKSGEITSIQEITVDLSSVEGVSPTEGCTILFEPSELGLVLSGEVISAATNISKLKQGDKLPLLSCLLNIPTTWNQADGYFIVREFRASLEYSYRIKKKIDFEVKTYALPQTIV